MLTTQGTFLKRKSIEKADPILPLPKKNKREKTQQGRTKHKDHNAPSEQLKQFRKKQLYTISTDKSLSNLNSEDYQLMKQSRFDDDHHNTASIAQLLNSKMNSNVNTYRTRIDEQSHPSIPNSDDKITSQRQSKLDSSIAAGETESQKEGQNYDDYVLGQKVDQQSQYSQDRPVMKKYTRDERHKSLTGYIPKSESQLRLENHYWNTQRKKFLQLREDKEILSILQEYQHNKQKIMNQSRKKHETTRVLAAIRNPQKVEKSLSLPQLKPKMEVVVPEIIYEQESNLQKVKKNIIAKGFTQEEDEQTQIYHNRIKKTLSVSKLGFGAKRVRTICEQDIYEDQMADVEQIRNKLRSKGIFIKSQKLQNGLINNKNYLIQEKAEPFPSKYLPSNPIYQKFPLGK